ncbi:MAG: hypothetical protein J6S71_02945 [Clostridia bacterium]|nr:hypothetical protein [Clostridia bacterium]
MTNKERLQKIDSDLQTLINKANALKPSAEGKFTIGSREYTFRIGMTWLDFVNSAYNKDNFYEDMGCIYSEDGDDLNDGESFDYIDSSETIVVNGQYTWDDM